MYVRAVVIWFVILLIAIANGAFRAAVLIPAFGEPAGHEISTVLLSIAVLIAAWLSAGWIGIATRGDGVRVGVLWLLLTVAFELFGGHYLFGAPWSQLLADYDIMSGRIWVLVLLTTAAAPALVVRARQRA